MKFNLTTDDIFTRKGQKVKVLTSGMDISEFINNPLMLSEHNNEKVIGTWAEISKLNDRIIAEPNFDDDEFSVQIKSKVNKGTIKSASVGIEVLDAQLDGDTLVLTKTVLLEASLVGLPANKKAKKVDNSNKVLLFSNGSDCDVDELVKEIKDKNMVDENVKTEIEDDNIVQVEDIVENNDNVDDVVLESVEPEIAVELEEVLLGNENNRDILIDEPIKIESEVEVNLNNTDLEPIAEVVDEISILKLNFQNEKDNFIFELSNKDAKIAELETKLNAFIDEKKEMLLNNAVSEGKIALEAKQSFKDLNIEKMEDILSKLSPKNVSLSNTLSNLQNSGNNVKDYDWYLKNDKDGLRKLSKENISLYKQLENDYINKLNKK